MAPRKKTAKQQQVMDDVKRKKVEAFLQDYDGEVKSIVERLKMRRDDLLRKSQNAYDMALIKLPKQIRQMNWLEYYRSEKAKEPEADTTKDEDAKVDAKVDTVLAEIHDIPPPTVKKAATKKKSSSEDEENNPAVKAKKGRPVKKPPRTATKKAGALSVCKQNTSVRKSNRKPMVTPARSMLDSSLLVGATPLITPRFDPRLPKTPAVGQSGRAPRNKERVRLYSISVNGSPMAAATEAVISIPIGNGESIQLLSSEMDSMDFSSLDENALRSIQQLQNRLAVLCPQNV